MRTRCAPMIAAILVASMASAMTTKQALRELQQELKKVTKAFQDKNIDAFTSTIARDFTATGPTGKVEKRDGVIASFKAWMGALHNVTWDRKIVSVKKNGKNFETATVSKLKGKVMGQDKKEHVMEFDATSQDEWDKSSGRWQDHASKLLKARSAFDGREMPMR